ncbi:MAG: hypothetical protein ACFFD4_32330 [Candidatus Odinarchaeota archaeon]
MTDFINSFSLPDVQEQNRNMTGEMIVDKLKYFSKLINAGINFYYSNSTKYRKYTRFGSFIPRIIQSMTSTAISWPFNGYSQGDDMYLYTFIPLSTIIPVI